MSAALGLVAGLLGSGLPGVPFLLAPLLLLDALAPPLRAPLRGALLGLLLGGAPPAPPAPGLPRLAEVRARVRACDPPGPQGQRVLLDVTHDGAAAREVRVDLGVVTLAPGPLGPGNLRGGTVGPGERGAPRLRPGDEVAAVLHLAPVPAPLNPGQRDLRPAAERRGVGALGRLPAPRLLAVRARGDGLAGAVFDLRDAAARRLAATLPSRDAGLARALVLGDRDAAHPADRALFREAGQQHLVAVSGQHVALVLAGVLWAARRLGAGRTAATLLGLAAVLLYVPLSGAAPSSVRSGAGAVLWLLARLCLRPASGLPLLSAVALGMLVAAPLDLDDPGFALSFGAVLGIEVLTPRLTDLLVPPRPRLPGLLEPPRAGVRRALAVSLAAWLGSAPVALVLLGQLHPLAALLALPAVPLTAGLLLLGTLALLPDPLGPGAGACFGLGADLLRALLAAPGALGLTNLEAPPPGAVWLLLSTAVLLVLGLGPRRLARWMLLAETLLLAAALTPAPPPRHPEVVLLATGGAPAQVLRLPDGRCVLLHAGPSPGAAARVVLPALRALGVSRLALALEPPPEAGAAERAALARVRSTVPVERVLPADEAARTVPDLPRARQAAAAAVAGGAAQDGRGALVLTLGPVTQARPALAAAARRDGAWAAYDPAMPVAPAPSLLGVCAAAGLLALFALLCVRPLGWLRPGGAAGALTLGTLAYAGLGLPGLAALFAPFVAGTLLGRLPGRARERGRTLRQVLANGLPAALGALLALLGHPAPGAALLVGGLACLGADTCATEIGTRYGGTPRSLVGGRALRPGESGGVTLAGLLASLAGAWLAPGAYLLAHGGGPVEAAALAAAAGFAGALLDSALGATLQYRGRDPRTGEVTEARRLDGRATEPLRGLRWLDNDAVNLVTVLAAAAFAALLL